MFDRLSEELKQAREKSGLTLQQLVNKTKIDIRFLEAMEDGNFSFQPDLYVRAFLKSYAKFVGLDENLIVRKYQALKEGKPYQEQTSAAFEDKVSPQADNERREAPKEIKKQENIKSSPPKYNSVKGEDYSDQGNSNKRNIVLLSVIGGVVLLIVLIYFFFFRSDSDLIVTEKPYEEIIEENSDRYADLEPKADTVIDNSAAPGFTSDSLKLLILTNDTSWVKITIDNTRSDEFILFPGGQKTIVAKDNYRIIFGNTRSIKLQLNNKPLDFTSTGGRVAAMTIDTGGIHLASAPVKK